MMIKEKYTSYSENHTKQTSNFSGKNVTFSKEQVPLTVITGLKKMMRYISRAKG
jgi:hypothetical protein